MKRRYTIAIGIIVFLVLLYIVTGIEAYYDRAFICENTGSRKGYREWFWGLQTGQWYEQSTLEAFMQDNYPDVLEHRWTRYEGWGNNLIGMRISDGHGRPGPIMQFPEGMLEDWMQKSQPEEILALYELLASDESEEIKEQRVAEIINEILKF